MMALRFDSVGMDFKETTGCEQNRSSIKGCESGNHKILKYSACSTAHICLLLFLHRKWIKCSKVTSIGRGFYFL